MFVALEAHALILQDLAVRRGIETDIEGVSLKAHAIVDSVCRAQSRRAMWMWIAVGLLAGALLFVKRIPLVIAGPRSLSNAQRTYRWYDVHVERNAETLAEYVDALQERSQYTFSRAEALAALGSTPIALKRAAERLKAKKRLATPRRGFYAIVPLEYRQSGSPPAASFIDQLMRFHGTAYYVGLLSAAEIHGAAHQRPQEFQVFAAQQLRPIEVGRNRIRFFLKKNLAQTPVRLVKTSSGQIRVSTPEATALDLVRFSDRAGHLNHVATVLSELAEKIDASKLVQAVEADGEAATAQRLGYLLEKVGANKAAAKLAKWIDRRSPKFVHLRPDTAGSELSRDGRWRVVVNEAVEPDEV